MCIEELNILGHGHSGCQNLVSVNADDTLKNRYGSLTAMKNISGQWKFSGLEVFNNVKFCTPCKIYLRGCSVGNGEAGCLYACREPDFCNLQHRRHIDGKLFRLQSDAAFTVDQTVQNENCGQCL